MYMYTHVHAHVPYSINYIRMWQFCPSDSLLIFQVHLPYFIIHPWVSWYNVMIVSFCIRRRGLCDFGSAICVRLCLVHDQCIFHVLLDFYPTLTLSKLKLLSYMCSECLYKNRNGYIIMYRVINDCVHIANQLLCLGLAFSFRCPPVLGSRFSKSPAAFHHLRATSSECWR